MISPPVPAEIDPPLRLVSPPYVALESLPGEPPVGSIFVLDADRSGSALGSVISALRAAPWAPMVVVTRSRGTNPEVLRVLESVQGTPAFLVRRSDDISLSALALDAVRGRQPVHPDQVAAYVAGRLRRPAVTMPLAIALASPPRGLARVTFGVRWLAGRLHTMGDLTATDWREVFHFAASAGSVRLTVAQAAERAERDLWTLRRRLQQLGDVTVDQYREYAGWEWFVESVLRKHCGLARPVPESQALPPGRQEHLK
jgi:hypothetical protein